jgi:hypothetical protein
MAKLTGKRKYTQEATETMATETLCANLFVHGKQSSFCEGATNPERGAGRKEIDFGPVSYSSVANKSHQNTIHEYTQRFTASHLTRNIVLSTGRLQRLLGAAWGPTGAA